MTNYLTVSHPTSSNDYPRSGKEITEVADEKTTVTVIDVVKLGEKLVIPEKASYDDAIAALVAKKEHEEQVVHINTPLEGAFCMDAANAFAVALEEKFGYVAAKPIPSWFGPKPPTLINVRTGLTTSVQVPLGRFQVPGIEDGFVQTEIDNIKGVATFIIHAMVKRRYEHIINGLIELTRKISVERSIYRGKAIRVRFIDDEGIRISMPEPQFIDLKGVKEDELIYSDSVMRQISTSIFTPIEQTDLVRRSGIPLKRGVLMTGPFGVGKSMTGAITAVKATRNGWTYIMVERADELSHCIKLAQKYSPAVLFCEDLDSVMSGSRNLGMNEVLELIDGVEAKSTELMIVLTTNNVNDINQAMFRPGRLDAIIEVSPPDAKAVERLCRLYGRGLIPETEDLRPVGMAFEGQIPAVVREMVERAKLHAIRLGTIDEQGRPVVTCQALLDSAEEMTLQRELLAERQPDTRSERVKAASIMAAGYDRVATAVLQAAGALPYDGDRKAITE